jgi:hypothetical protein
VTSDHRKRIPLERKIKLITQQHYDAKKIAKAAVFTA